MTIWVNLTSKIDHRACVNACPICTLCPVSYMYHNTGDVQGAQHARHFRASIHWADGRLTARSRKVSKPRDSGLDYPNRSEIWQAPRQQRCRDACQISERYTNFNIQYHGLRDFTGFGGKTAYRLMNRCPDVLTKFSCCWMSLSWSFAWRCNLWRSLFTDSIFGGWKKSTDFVYQNR